MTEPVELEKPIVITLTSPTKVERNDGGPTPDHEVGAEENSDPLTVRELIEQLVEIRDEKTHLTEKDKILGEQYRALETVLMAKLDEQGMKRATIDGVATATLTEQVVPNVTDWDAVYGYILENEAMHLLQKRPATAAFRELHESGEAIPGIEPYTKRTISLRKRT